MPSPRTHIIAPLIVGCAQFMHQFDGAVITTALPAMAESLHDDPVRLNLAIACYLLSLAVFVPVSGWMADRFGAKKVFTWAIVVFTVSSVLCGLAQSFWALVIMRTIQGMGGAMMTPVGRVIVVKSVPRQQLVTAMNYITIPAVLGPLLGPAVGGFIVTYFSWHWIFFLNLPIGLAGILLVRRFIPDIREEHVGPLDVRGFVLISLALTGLVFGFSALGRGVLSGPVIAATIAGGAICAALYLLHARRTPAPIIDLTLLRIRTFSASTVGGALFFLGTVSSVFALALLLQLGFGLSAFQAGLITLASADLERAPDQRLPGELRVVHARNALRADHRHPVHRRLLPLGAVHRRAITRLCRHADRKDKPRHQLLRHDTAAEPEPRRRSRRDRRALESRLARSADTDT